MSKTTPFLPGLSPIGSKPLTAARDAGNLTSNGGAVVLREAALRLGLGHVIAGPLPETRNPALATHSYADIATECMMAIALARRHLRDDPGPAGEDRLPGHRTTHQDQAVVSG